MTLKSYKVAVVGATGLVGQEMLKILEQRRFPVKEIVPIASERSAGKSVRFAGSEVPIRVLSTPAFAGVELALFSAGGNISRDFAPVATSAGALVVDNSSVFRMDPDVPLVIPEVNPEAIQLATNKRIIANPNCSAIPLIMVIHALCKHVRVTRVVVSTYQSVSGAGRRALQELIAHSQDLALTSPRQYAFNCIPQIGEFTDDGFTAEEKKIPQETHKILNDASIGVVATTVRVPAKIGHSLSINLECADAISLETVKDALRQADGISLVENAKDYPTPLDVAGKDDVYVGRIRRDPTVPHGICLWAVSDNLRKGAALNAIQIAENVLL
ncbi:MAG: aspartate-semialdehyde dehydrogenase [Deltaproteobacteria bacterium]|nr:aspartate-semialdehyde dehydrogenase [Deltaproteobacteria bacterium]